MWTGIRCITDDKKSDAQCPEDLALPDSLNPFFARFEASNTTTPSRLTPSPDETPVFTITTAVVRRTLQRVNPRKALGPDVIPGRILKDCADQLSEVLADIFNTSVSQARVPSGLKTSTIIPVPKTPAVSSLNDHSPIALTPVRCVFIIIVLWVLWEISNETPKTVHRHGKRVPSPICIQAKPVHSRRHHCCDPPGPLLLGER